MSGAEAQGKTKKKKRVEEEGKKKGGRVQESNLGLYHQVEFYH